MLPTRLREQNESDKVLIKGDSMSVRRILAKTINTDLEYEAIGIDLAKNCVSAALLTTDGEVICIDHLDYSELEKSAQTLSPTTFAMEPCTEMNYLVQKLEAWGHRCLIIGGKNVRDYIESHFSGQKTDLNDAQALAFLTQDTQLRTITAKDLEQQKYASLTTLREQYIKQYRQTIVSLKGICQAWGLNISKGISGKARLRELIENHTAFPKELREGLVDMVTHAQTTQKTLNRITKTLEELAKNDQICQLIQTIPGLGPICSCRLRATIGDIKRFKKPKDFPAYYGLVPRSIATGHNEKKGKITHRGDKTMRSLMVQGAGSVINMATKGKLKSRQLTKWVLKKQKEKMPWGKLVCAVAAKLLRIVRAVLNSGRPFNPKIAGVAKCSLPKVL